MSHHSRSVRRPVRCAVLAATAALIAGIVPGGTSEARGAASLVAGADSAHASTGNLVADSFSMDKGRSTHGTKSEHDKSVTVRIRRGQTLSMSTLRPIEPRVKGGAGHVPRGRRAPSWSLVAAPDNTQLSHVPGAPTFTPDVHGTYVFERRPGKARGAGLRRTLTLQVDPSEQMVCVNTRAWPVGQTDTAPGMNVGAEFLPRSPGTVLQMVVLDRDTTGHLQDGPTNTSFTAAQVEAGEFLDHVSSLDSSHLVLVSGDAAPRNTDLLLLPLQRLGATELPIQPGLPFSLIGVPGISEGSAWQTAATPGGGDVLQITSCAPDLTTRPAGNLGGWLTIDMTGDSYTYVSPDFVDFDTDARAPQGSHAISVGNQTYSVPTGQWNGFHAVVLDRRALCSKMRPLRECNPGVPLLDEGYGPEGGGLDQMERDLTRWARNPNALLFLAPFSGTDGPMPDVVPSHSLLLTLRAFGASPLAPGRSLGNQVKYALVGGGANEQLPPGSAEPIVAESFTGFGQTGHIAGTLVRDHQNRFGARRASLTGTPLDNALGEIVYGPLSPWPEEGHPDLETAFSYLSGKLGYPIDQYPQGIRQQYLTWTTEASVPDPQTRLQQSWCTAERPSNVDATACATVLHELRNEFLEVKYVDHFLATLNTAYTEVEGENKGQDIILVVEDDIKKLLTPPPAQTSVALTIVDAVLSVASILPGVGEAFVVAGAALDVAVSLSTNRDGSSADPMQVVYDTGDELMRAVDSAFSTAVDQIDAYQPLIVSDYGKLTLVGHLAALDKFQDGTDLPNPPWAFTETDLAKARSGLELALKQWLYPALVHAGFPAWRVVIPSSDGNNPADRTPVTYRCTSGFGTTHPFEDEPVDGWINLSDGRDDFYLALGGTRFSAEELQSFGHHAPVPEADLLMEMFEALPDHVALDRTWYFEHTYKRQLDTEPLSIECFAKEN